MDIRQFGTNQEKETSGVWVPIGHDLQVKICRIGNERYESYLRQIGKPMKHQLRRGDADPKESKSLLIRAIARHVLVDWDGLEEPDENGKLHKIEYSEKKAIQLLEDYPEFYRLILDLGNDPSLFKDDDEGNSEPSSDGQSSMGSTSPASAD